MVKSCIFDNAGMLKRHPDIPHYGEDVVCFESVYGDRNYPEGEAYFNRELYLIFILTVNDVSVKLNFSDTSAFCKFFRRCSGETPLGFRKKLWMEMDKTPAADGKK